MNQLAVLSIILSCIGLAMCFGGESYNEILKHASNNLLECAEFVLSLLLKSSAPPASAWIWQIHMHSVDEMTWQPLLQINVQEMKWESCVLERLVDP